MPDRAGEPKPSSSQSQPKIGLVAIGRNEGERLRQCLKSALGKVARIVYVDSGSTDGSVEMARSLGVDVVELDLSVPFTAARARNEGFDLLRQTVPNLEFVQFVDGDCEIADRWIDRAVAELVAKPEVAVVCGRRRESFPEQSIYNRLCDLEWDTPVGETKACGGDSMMRVEALSQVEGFNPSLIAGEEPELCVRLRQKGWKIFRLDAEMTRHDARMMHFSQWWMRMLRAGHAYAEGAWVHGKSPERHWVKETKSIWLWGFCIPFLALVMAWPTKGLSLFLLVGYPLLAYRVTRYLQTTGKPKDEATLYGIFCTIGKFPNFLGQLKFFLNRLLKKQNRLIEYKTVDR
ncbi:glycosyltransferase family 2 protein [Oscillatoriales cyanobacterium LEGE 11467]|uniref:Glycosyltransferase family 2 protein n=1 Tax=Zarconia navalis LEGE 11467 TaxID=1828826 RepID=A0A928VX42_9CYAN|nr:glycosyltransferase family 2 protein [Zarconia navalis]MBE9041736.1 glycosyltransferase family 2 protein [Zarconia navalis LEGE 11467]